MSKRKQQDFKTIDLRDDRSDCESETGKKKQKCSSKNPFETKQQICLCKNQEQLYVENLEDKISYLQRILYFKNDEDNGSRQQTNRRSSNDQTKQPLVQLDDVNDKVKLQAKNSQINSATTSTSGQNSEFSKEERFAIMNLKLDKIFVMVDEIGSRLNIDMKSFDRKKSVNKVPLYEDKDDICEFVVDKERLAFAISAGTGCAFASRILSGLFNTVAELYDKSWSGQRPRMADLGQNVKQELNRAKKNALKNAVRKRYPHDNKAESGLTAAIGNKLSKFQVLFQNWKNGLKSKSSEIDGLNYLDEIGTDFDLYRNDPSLFDKIQY